MRIFDKLFAKKEEKHDEDRPCRLLEEKKNVWRVVYADEIEEGHN